MHFLYQLDFLVKYRSYTWISLSEEIYYPTIWKIYIFFIGFSCLCLKIVKFMSPSSLLRRNLVLHHSLDAPCLIKNKLKININSGVTHETITSKMKGIETTGVPYLHQLGTQFYCICMQLWKALIISQTNIEFNSPWGIRRKLTPGTLPASRKPYEVGRVEKPSTSELQSNYLLFWSKMVLIKRNDDGVQRRYNHRGIATL